MLKKLLLITAALLVVSMPVLAVNDVYTLTDPVTQTPIFNVDSAGVIWSSAGITCPHEFWVDVPITSSISVRGFFTQAVSMSTSTLLTTLSGTTTYTLKDITQPVYPMNITGNVVSTSVAQSGCEQGNFTSSATMRVQGYNAQKAWTDETVIISTGDSGWTRNAFATISSITITATAINGVTLNGSNLLTQKIFLLIGHGVKMGLANNIDTRDCIYKVIEAGADVNPKHASLLVDTTYDTIDFVTNPNSSNDYHVWYNTRSK